MFKLGKTLATSVAAFGLCGGLAFLAGCNDNDECDSCDHPRCSACGDEVITEPVSTWNEGDSGEPVNTNYVRENDQTPPAATREAPVDNSANLREVEIRHKRDRLLEIDREKVLYPERTAQLNEEAAQIDRDLRSIEANMKANGELSPTNTNYQPEENIQVRDQSNLGKPAEPLPAETAKSAPMPDKSAQAPAAPMPEPSAQPEPQAAPPAEPAPSAEPAPAPNADQRSELLLNDPELMQACQKLETDMDQQKNASNSEPSSDETVPYPTSTDYPENSVK